MSKPLEAVAQSIQLPVEVGASRLRVIDSAAMITAYTEDVPVVFQHSVLCQTCLPYRDPGDDVLIWQRNNGFVSLRLQAGAAYHPSGKWVQLRLPYGPKPRQILSFLNTQAITRKSRVVDVEDTMMSFVAAMGYHKNGRNFRTVKEQITRLAAADFAMGISRSGTSAETHKGSIVASFDLWCEKDANQRVLWPRSITLAETYYRSLIEHAVPLDKRAIAALGHSALALDIYAWLAQRLHRVSAKAPALLMWPVLHRQFGVEFARMRKFREKFVIALKAALVVYPDARVEVDDRGLTLHNSRPPVTRRLARVGRTSSGGELP